MDTCTMETMFCLGLWGWLCLVIQIYLNAFEQVETGGLDGRNDGGREMCLEGV